MRQGVGATMSPLVDASQSSVVDRHFSNGAGTGLIDADNDGVVTRQELATTLKEVPGLSPI